MLLLLLALFPLLAIGCGTRTYRIGVDVINRADQPAELWLIKDGTPIEMDWVSPSQLLVFFGKDDLTVMEPEGITLPPGARVTIGPRKGKFDGGAGPRLYVYPTGRTLTQLASIDRRGETMADLSLGEGMNLIIIDSVEPTAARRVNPQAFEQAITQERGQ